MKLLLYDKIYLSLKELTNKDLYYFIKQYTRSNPKYYFFKKQHIPTYNTPRELVFYKKTDEYLLLPIGAIWEVVKYFEFYKIPVELVDKRIEGRTIDANFDASVPLEDYQIEAFQAMLGSKYQNGLLQLPPGAGKTFLGLKYICEMKKNALIIVHEDRLVQQWLAEIKQRISGKFTVGTFSGDGHNLCDITIALIQSSSKHFEVYDQFKEFGIVIVDESHHSSSNTFVKLLDGLPAKYKFGISGTLKRKDRLDFIIPFYIGDKIIDIPDSRVKKRITDFEAEFVPTHCNIHVPRKELKSWQQDLDGDELAPVEHNLLYEYLTGFKGAAFYKGKTPEEIIAIGNEGVSGKRNKLIVQLVLRNIKDGHKPLILTNRKMHAEYFLYALREHGVEGVSFSSDEDEKSNSTAYGDLRKGLEERDGFDKIDFIVSTERIAAEGLDITDLSALHITIPSVNEHKLKQCAGRIRRVKEGKNFPIIYDYFDREMGSVKEADDYFLKKAKQRDKYYKEWKREYHA